jgi:deoxycytidine triphosphate deaminase
VTGIKSESLTTFIGIPTLYVPANLAAQVNGKSGLARCGLAVHATAPHINPGFEGANHFGIIQPWRMGIRVYTWPGPDLPSLLLADQNACARSGD